MWSYSFSSDNFFWLFKQIWQRVNCQLSISLKRSSLSCGCQQLLIEEWVLLWGILNSNSYNTWLKNVSLQFKWARFEKWSDFTLLSKPFVRRFALAIVLLALDLSSQMYFHEYLYSICICICICICFLFVFVFTLLSWP